MEGFFQCYFRLYRPLITALNEILSKHNLSYSFWQVIYCAKHYGPTTLVEIAKRYNVEKPTITRRVNYLEKLKLIEKIESVDKREKVIRLTPEGEELYKKCRREITDFEMHLTEHMSKEELEHFFKILLEIEQKLINKEGKL